MVLILYVTFEYFCRASCLSYFRSVWRKS